MAAFLSEHAQSKFAKYPPSLFRIISNRRLFLGTVPVFCCSKSEFLCDGLSALLSPAWMIQRASGTWADRATYTAAMPDVRQYQIADVMARYTAPTLVLRSRTATQEPDAAGVLRSSALAPRLSTFTWMGGRWRMTSHANFNPPG